jgi:hypothetical protein
MYITIYFLKRNTNIITNIKKIKFKENTNTKEKEKSIKTFF